MLVSCLSSAQACQRSEVLHCKRVCKKNEKGGKITEIWKNTETPADLQCYELQEL